MLNRELKSPSPPARARVLEDYGRLRSDIAGLVREGIASGEFRPVDAELAANLIEAICAIWPLRQFAVGRIGREAFGAAALMFLRHALAADAR